MRALLATVAGLAFAALAVAAPARARHPATATAAPYLIVLGVA